MRFVLDVLRHEYHLNVAARTKKYVALVSVVGLLPFSSSCAGRSLPGSQKEPTSVAAGTTTSTLPRLSLDVRLANWDVGVSTAVQSNLRSMGLRPFSVTFQTKSLEALSTKQQHEIATGLPLLYNYRFLPQQCPTISSPFDYVRLENGKAPAIAKYVEFQNFKKDEVRSDAVWLFGDLEIFQGGAENDILNNYDRMLGTVGDSCEVRMYTFEESRKCAKFGPELKWNYGCSRRRFLKRFTDDAGVFSTAIRYKEAQDARGQSFPTVSLMTTQPSGSLPMVKFTMYGFSPNLQTTFLLSFVFNHNGKSKSLTADLNSRASEINAEVIKWAIEAMNTAP